MNNITILVTIFLGQPPDETNSGLTNSDTRYKASVDSLILLKSVIKSNYPMYVALTGDENYANMFIKELNLSKNKSHYFYQNDTLSYLGKGMLEHLLLTNAIKHWSFHLNDITIFKITGKYFIENIESCLKYISKIKTDAVAWKMLSGPVVDTRAFAFKASAYLNAHHIFDKIDYRTYYIMEHAVFTWISLIKGKTPYLINRPLVKGLSGHFGTYYRHNFLRRTLVYFISFFNIPI